MSNFWAIVIVLMFLFIIALSIWYAAQSLKEEDIEGRDIEVGDIEKSDEQI